MKGKFGQISKSLKILWPSLSSKFYFTFCVFIDYVNNYVKTVKGLTVIKIIKIIMFEGAWSKSDPKSWTKYVRQNLAFMWNSTLPQKRNFHFSTILLDKFFILGGRLGYNCMKFDIFLTFLNFLRSLMS